MNSDRTLLAPGELRVDLLELFRELGPELDVLVGIPGLMPFPRGTIEEIARWPARSLPAARAFRFRQLILEEFARQVDELPQTAHWERTLNAWGVWLASGKARVLLHESRPVFSRLISRADGALIPGRPLTLESADRSPDEELDVELSAEENLRARRWFNDLAARSEDISGQVRAILENSWAGRLLDPEDLYLGVLAEYFSVTLEGLDVELDDNPMLDVMTDFQSEAYHQAKGVLRRYGGVFLADVVGLGKTYIALALLRYLQDRHGEHPVVIAPPAVCPQWERLAAEFRIELRTVSHGKMDDLRSLEDREVLVIDESHNFRNPWTRRYQLLGEWLRPAGGHADRKVILVSATPQNNRPEDVLHQLRLFPDNFTRLPFRGESLDAFFSSVRSGEESMTTLLQHLVVRRTRRFIRSAYPDTKLRRRDGDGRIQEVELQFPTRISGPEQCLRYSIEDTYGGGLFDRIIHVLSTMRYPLYGLAGYLRSDAADLPRFSGINRTGENLRGLMKVMLLKRLESSVEAFRLSLTRLRDRLENSFALLERGQVVVRARGRGPSGAADGPGEPVVESEWTEPTSSFDAGRLEADIWHDFNLVDSIIDGVRELDTAGDAKLRRLEAYLAARPPTRHRTVIFSQFADTVTWLRSCLAGEYGRTALVTGSTGNVPGIVRRFAPVGNRLDVPADEQIDLLLTTDALSEGVNLQDADTLINFDLHWNPVRLIQRAGRIDRIGSPNDEIHVASFLPERKLESELGLESVLRRRIDEFLKIFGEDSRVLPDAGEVPDEQEIIASYNGQALEVADDDDEIDALGKHAERILTLRRNDPTRFETIMETRAGRRALSSGRGSVVAARAGWFWTFWHREDGDESELRPVDDVQGLDLLRRHSNHGAASISEGPEGERESLGDLVESARAAFEPLANRVRQQRRQPRLDPTEEWVRSSLERYRKACVVSRRPVVADMIAWVLAGQHKVPLRRRARLWRRERLSPESVFSEMRYLVKRFPMVNEELDASEIVGAVLGIPPSGPEQPRDSRVHDSAPGPGAADGDAEAAADRADASSTVAGIGDCPFHRHSRVIRVHDHYVCEHQDCGIHIPAVRDGRPFSVEEIRSLVEAGETPVLDGFTGPGGTAYEASFFLYPDGTLGWLRQV
jgi:hypothetical protein